jgi:serine/threonine protein kinase
MIGTVLDGRYRVLQKLGEGGMGEVYLAEHIDLGRKEALKILHPKLAAEEQFVSRFRREARAANRVQHPNIVGVYDFGKLPDGRFFLSMEYADGKRLDETLRAQGALPLVRALHVLHQLAEAVDHAHSCGVVHRDLKPENLMLVERRGRGDVLKVLDFGIAKILAPDAGNLKLTGKGEVLGTPPYMAPEQFMDQGAEPRSDLYAIGCIAFELCVGQPPFVGRTMELTLAHLKKQPDRPSERKPEAKLPPELDALVLRCLEKNPDRRFQSGRELAEELRKVPGFQKHKSGPNRHSSHSMPILRDFSDPVDTEDRTAQRIALDSATHEVPLPEAVDMASTNPILYEDLLLARQSVMREIGEALIDLGHEGYVLPLAVSNIREAEDEVRRCDAEMTAIERREAELELSAREREGSLRFAIGELRFARTQAIDHGVAVDELTRQIDEMQHRLGKITDELDSELRQLSDDAVALAATRAHAAERVDALFAHLEPILDDLIPRYANVPAMRPLLARLASFRAMLR